MTETVARVGIISTPEKVKYTMTGSGVMDGETMRDGFQDLMFFPGHGRSVRGFKIITMLDDKTANKKKKERLLSWDVKGLYLWEHESIMKNIRFPKSQQNYVSCVVYVSKLGGKLS